LPRLKLKRQYSDLIGATLQPAATQLKNPLTAFLRTRCALINHTKSRELGASGDHNIFQK
jgi:hypothetical protein